MSSMSSRRDPAKVSDHPQRRKDDERELDKDSRRNQYGKDSYRHSDRYSSRNFHGYSRHDVYNRRDRRSDDEERHCSRDKYESSKHRSKDKELEPLSSDRHKYGNKDASTDRRHARDRYGHDRDDQDAKRDYCRSSGDLKGNQVSYHEESKMYRDDSSGRDHDGLHNRESYKNDQKAQNEDRLYGVESQESLSKKPKLFSSGWDAEYNKNANEKQKQVVEAEGKVTTGQVHVNNSEAASDLNAALKAAELVNKNLVGVGFMSTEQKKKLLWGNKKSTTSQESGHRWDTSLFEDRERREKFNKLMGVKGEVKMEQKPETEDGNGRLQAEKQKEVQMDLEKQYTAGLRRRDGRTVGLGL